MFTNSDVSFGAGRRFGERDLVAGPCPRAGIEGEGLAAFAGPGVSALSHSTAGCGRSRKVPCGAARDLLSLRPGAEAFRSVPVSLSAVRGDVSSIARLDGGCGFVSLYRGAFCSVRSLVESCAWELLLNSGDGNSYLHLSAALLSGFFLDGVVVGGTGVSVSLFACRCESLLDQA